MAYTRRTSTRRVGKRRRFRRRRRARKAVDRRQDRSISKLYRLVKNVKERKFVDQSSIDIAVGSTWTTLLSRDLTFIAQGDGQDQRIANKIKIQSHHLKFLCTIGDTTNIYRIIVVRFPNQAAADVNLADVLEDPLETSPINAMTNYKRNGDTKFQILWDTGIKRLDVNHPQHSYDIVLKKTRPYFAMYNSDVAGSCVSGYTYVLAVSDSGLAPSVGITTVARTVYTG